ncbi:hypothetical protein RO3G_10510 [Rhizopus delemar RA 99-880]|uniref:Uncharacterized protein n=1 Tax=Rhizopus delemar (strain RA 99-880 / ATCC MYA-4621 / FGSC 9543 / NRRL 43880) TaxID=246409 RepID=I1CBH0_RHIO9|nr:hypothetical protein RO3G_10510 [Rhizopus delemar RA 99-880]|eukprot:EIE85800.1 hypothetical protein RO3G_10510 [Rhizopus delemar RA 99-880]
MDSLSFSSIKPTILDTRLVKPPSRLKASRVDASDSNDFLIACNAPRQRSRLSRETY